MTSEDTTPIDVITDAFRWQAKWCTELGSPFTARVLDAIADDLSAGGPSTAVVEGFAEEPIAAALALRVAGGLATLVQTGQAKALSNYYPNGGAPAEGKGFIRTLINTVQRHQGFLKAFTQLAVQTNEVGRSACLLGGFLEISRHTEKPMHLFEIGAAAGLNLAWDHFRYRFDGQSWGSESALLTLAPQWRGGTPSLSIQPTIGSRHGCDLNPVNLHDPGFQRQAEAYIWPDQPERLERFRAAAEITRSLGIHVEKEDAVTWVAEKAKTRPENGVSVFYHSVFWQYLPFSAQNQIQKTIRTAGESATPTAPVAWLRMEPDNGKGLPYVDLTLWPGGATTRLAQCHPHGHSVLWNPQPLSP